MSQKRWETGRDYVTHLLPTLPSSSYAAVVLYCWFMGRSVPIEKHGRRIMETEFTESASQIAHACRLTPRRVQQIMTDLERSGVIETVSIGSGRTHPSTRIIKRKVYTPQSNGEAHFAKVRNGES